MNELEKNHAVNPLDEIETHTTIQEAAYQHEIEVARRIAESEKRRARSFQWLATGLAILLITAIGYAFFTARQQANAKIQENLHISRELTAYALSSLEVDPQRSILLSLQALNRSFTPEGEIVLREALRENREIKMIRTADLQGDNMAASIDGRWLAVTSSDSPSNFVTEIWNTSTWERHLILPSILAARNWPDGNRIATVDAGKDGNGEISYWDTNTGENILTIQSSYDNGPVAEFSNDWKLMAVSNWNGTTTISSLENGEILLTLGEPNSKPGFALAFSPDNKRLLTITNQQPGIWDIGTGQELVSLLPSGISSAAVAFSPDGKQVAVGNGSDIRISDSQTGQLLHLLKIPSGTISAVRYNQDGTLLATASSSGQAILWDIGKEKPNVTLNGHLAMIVDVDFIPFSNQLATSSLDGTIRIWDISPSGSTQGASFFDETEAGYNSIAYSPDGTRLAIGSISGTVEILDALTNKESVNLKGSPSQTWQGSITFSPDGSRLASTNGEINAHISDTSSGKELTTLEGHLAWIGDMAYSPNGEYLATIGYDGKAIVWDTDLGLKLFAVQAYTDTVDTSKKLGITFSPDGLLFATAGGYTPRVWKAANGVEVHTLPRQETMVYSLDFSPDGKYVAIGLGLSSGARVYDLTTGQFTAELQDYNGSIMEIAFSKDGKQIITGSRQGTIKIWDASNGQEQLNIGQLSSWISGLAISQDGRKLAATSGTEARIYILAREELIQFALQHLSRWFTPDECRIFLHVETCPEKP